MNRKTGKTQLGYFLKARLCKYINIFNLAWAIHLLKKNIYFKNSLFKNGKHEFEPYCLKYAICLQSWRSDSNESLLFIDSNTDDATSINRFPREWLWRVGSFYWIKHINKTSIIRFSREWLWAGSCHWI